MDIDFVVVNEMIVYAKDIIERKYRSSRCDVGDILYHMNICIDILKEFIDER